MLKKRKRKNFEKIICSCGCGEELYKYDDRNRVRSFVHGHKLIDSLWVRFTNNISPDKETGCWNWSGSRDGKDGKWYGRLHYKGKAIRVHRLSYEKFNKKKIPDGMCICHRCDNAACVNPDHLFLGTQKDNILDMISKGRAAWQNKQ